MMLVNHRYIRPGNISRLYSPTLVARCMTNLTDNAPSKTQQFKSIKPPLEFLEYLDKIQIGHIRNPIKRKTGRITGSTFAGSMDDLPGEKIRPSKAELKRNFREKYRSGADGTTSVGDISIDPLVGFAKADATVVGGGRHLSKPYPFDIPSRKVSRFLKADYPGQIFPNAVIPEVVAIGRSNAGKSTLINSLLGFRAHIQQSTVTAKPGETRSLHFYGIPFSSNEQALAVPKELDDGSGSEYTDTYSVSENTSAATKAPPYSLIVVDMPGFGFSYMNEKELYRCRQLCFEYLCSRGDVLKAVMLCVDARHGLKLADKHFFAQLLEHRVKASSSSSSAADRLSPKRCRVFPWDLHIVLTKCDLIDRVELAKRMIFVKEEVQGMLRELMTKHGFDRPEQRTDLRIVGFIEGSDCTVPSLLGHIFPVSAQGQSSMGHRAGVVGGSQCKGLLGLQQHLSGIVDRYLPFAPYVPPVVPVEESVSDVSVLDPDCVREASKPAHASVSVSVESSVSEATLSAALSTNLTRDKASAVSAESKVTDGPVQSVRTTSTAQSTKLAPAVPAAAGKKPRKVDVATAKNSTPARARAASATAAAGAVPAASVPAGVATSGSRRQRRSHLFVPAANFAKSPTAVKAKAKTMRATKATGSSNIKDAEPVGSNYNGYRASGSGTEETTGATKHKEAKSSLSKSFSRMKAYRAQKKQEKM